MYRTEAKILIVVATIIVFSIAQLPVALSATETSDAAKEVLRFMKDVVLIDTDKYEIAESSKPSVAEFMLDVPRTFGRIGFSSESSFFEVTYGLVDGKLVSCALYPETRSPLYTQQIPDDKANAVSLFLERYEVYSGDEGVAAMRNAMTNVDASKNSTKVSDNIKVEVRNTERSIVFKLERTYNGADYPGMVIVFEGNDFSSFNQEISFYKIGNTDVKITETQAIDLALAKAETFSYQYSGEKIENLTFLKDASRAELQVMNRNPLELYPFWAVDVALDSIYPGYVTFLRVNIWADTGEVFEVKPLGIGGDFQPDSSSASTSPQPTVAIASDAASLPIYVGAVIAAVIVALVGIIIWRRSK